MRAVTTVPALIYTAANLIASMLALWLLLNVWVDIFPGDDTLPNNVKRVLVAGFGAVAFFRTSIFTLRVNETDLAVGPSLILDTLMTAADRAVDRKMAKPRAERVGSIMRGVVFDEAKISLPTHCFALMQNITADEQQQFAMQIDSLANADMSDTTKSLNLGLALMNLVGDDVLQIAVDNLASEIGLESVDE